MDNTKNKIGVIFLIIVLLLFIVGGYFFMEYMLKAPDKTKSTKKDQEITDIRINKKKDYIYFENTTEIINDIFKQDVIFNIKGLENYNNTLHNELEELSKNEVKVTNEEIPEGITCENDLYSFVTMEEIDKLKNECKLVREKIISQDGLTDYFRREINSLDEEEFKLYLKYHFSICEKYEFLGTSSHVMDILIK